MWPSRIRTLVWGAAVPLLIAIAGPVILLSVRSQLPATVATHWGTNGPDKFSPISTAIAQSWVLTGVIAVLSLGMTALALWRETEGATRRIAIAVSLFTATMITTIQTASLLSQRGLADTHAAQDVTGLVALGLATGLALAVAGAFLAGPPAPRPATANPTATRAELRTAGARTPSFRERLTGYTALIVVGAVALLAVVLCVITRQTGWMWAIVALVTGLLVVAATSMSGLDLTIDRHGVAVTSTFGWRLVHIPLDQVADAQATTVHPLADFGGWGMRVGPRGSTGVVFHKGPALRLTLTDGRSYVISCRGASRAVSQLEG